MLRKVRRSCGAYQSVTTDAVSVDSSTTRGSIRLAAAYGRTDAVSDRSELAALDILEHELPYHFNNKLEPKNPTEINYVSRSKPSAMESSF